MTYNLKVVYFYPFDKHNYIYNTWQLRLKIEGQYIFYGLIKIQNKHSRGKALMMMLIIE